MFSTRRPSLPLDGTWDFIPDPERRLGPDRLRSGTAIVVPGAWEAQLAEPYGIVHAWYRRHFTVPRDWAGGTLVLRFGAAMARATVWLDGRRIGENEDGYLPFEVDAGPARPGAEHELAVSVENPLNALSDYPAFAPEVLQAARDRLGDRSFDSMPHGKQTWYTSTSGLLGSVVAELGPDARFAALEVLPDLDAEDALVRWRLAGPPADDRTLRLAVISPDGRIVAETSADPREGAARMAIRQPERWDLWRPALYRLDARLEGRGAVDEATVPFGMRSIAVREGAIVLNGRPIYLRGALDQDFWPIGRSNPPSRAALEAQVARAREMGLNLLRCHLKIPDPAYLDVADEAGLLLWCELPNWSRFELGVAADARRMLARMVETMGHHPSIVAWTVINEDWGTDLRYSARDRRWLRGTVDRLKVLDPTRLVVDNSACESSHGPGFHLRSDLADFHAYRSMPDGLARWRALVDDFARRPGWLWSPHGDAAPSGAEALVLSEFGGWGLPRPPATRTPDGREPWWWRTGLPFNRPAGMERRFEQQRLDRVWPNLDALAEATEWRQVEGIAAQVHELRRHPSIRGYVITEFADAGWEANGLLDMTRRPKAAHRRLAEINAPDVLVVELPRADLWGGETIVCEVRLSSFADSHRPAPGGGELHWELRLSGDVTAGGATSFDAWPSADVIPVARLELEVPDVERISEGELLVTATGAQERAAYRKSVVVVPGAQRRSATPRRIRVVDPLGLWSIGTRLRGLGHEVSDGADGELVVASRLDPALLDEVARGARLLLLARSEDALPDARGLARPAAVRCRRPADDVPPEAAPWNGDWISVFAWALPGVIPGLPRGGLLGDPQGEIFADHVLAGLDPAAPKDGVEVGMFAGWVQQPAALLAAFAQGAGRITATTLRLAPENGPVATALLESLIQRALGSSVSGAATAAGSVARR